MKNRLFKIWSIVLTISILAGLLVVATPVAAGNLSWTTESTPSGTGNVLVTSTGPWMLEGAADGKTFLAYDGTTLYKSTDGGLTFSANTTTPGLSGTLVAMAISPDFANDRVVVAASASTVFYSVNGGSSFTAIAGSPAGITSVDVAPYWQGNIGILVGTGSGAFLALASTSGFAGAFQNVNALTGGGTLAAPVLGVSFSPNHRTDAMMFFASTNGSNVVVSNKFANTAINGQFGAATLTGASATAAYFAFPADYDREGNNRFFVGLAGASGEVYRVAVGVGATASTAADLNASGDSTVATNVRSLSFKGNIADGYLYVGRADAASVRRATATTASPVTFTPSNRLSGSTDTIVFASPASGDTNVYAITSGTGAAFQVSTDNAATFNMLSLIGGPTSPAIRSLAMVDVNTRYMVLEVSAAGVLFKTTNGGTNWQGIYWPPSGSINSVYLSPNFATDNTLFLTGNDTVVRRSNNGGVSFSVLLNANLTPTTAFAVIDANTFFVGATGSIYKSGSQTAAPVSGTVTSLVALDANTIVAGTSAGNVYLSTNGGTSYSMLGTTAVGGSATNTYVMPDVNYATNKIIYAANEAGIRSWTVDTSTAFTALPGPAVTTVKGLMMGTEGTIYASTDNGVLRSIDAYAPIPAFGSTAPITPARVVKVLATGTATAPNNTLYVVTGGNALRSFQDTLVVAPAVVAPAANSSVSRTAPFTWSAVPVPAGYTVQYTVEYADAASAAINAFTSVTPAFGLTSAMPAENNPLVAGGKYTWKVTATKVKLANVEYNMKSKTSAPVTFNVKLNENEAPITFNMSPGPGAADVATKPTFQWSPVAGATGYDLQVSDNPVFVNPIDNQTNLATNVWTLTKTLENNKTYYWRVRAVNGNTGAVGDWVQQAFTTAAVPPVTPTQPPAQTTTITTTVTPTMPPITLTVPPQTTTPAPPPATPAYIWVIIAIGAILVIAVIVLIARTRRV